MTSTLSKNTEKRTKILFLLNQILDDRHFAGGEVRAIKLLSYFNHDPDFEVSLMIPRISQEAFKDLKLIFVGLNFVEKLLEKLQLKRTVLIIFILYIFRTIESFKYLFRSDYRVIYTTGDFFCNTFFAYGYKLLHPQAKWVSCVHHINESPFERKSNRFVNSTVSFISQRVSFLLMSMCCDLITVTNPLVSNFLTDYGFSQEMTIIAGNGLDVESIVKFCEEHPGIQPVNRICYFGRVNRTKGVFDLPVIFKNILAGYPNYYLDVVGDPDPDIMEKLKEEFTKNGCLERVVFHGFLPSREEVYKVVLNSSLVINPSYEEGWCIALFEAMVCKRPVVAYELPVFQHLFSGILKAAPIGDSNTLTKLALQMLDPLEKESVIKNVDACYAIASKYKWSHVFETEKNSIESLL